MERIRKNYSPAFKAKVALEAIKEVKTMVELFEDGKEEKRKKKPANRGAL